MPKDRLPKDSSYYFNILVKCIAISPQCAEECEFPDGVQEIWYLDNINSSHPFITRVYVDNGLDEENFDADIEFADTLFEVYCYPHQVVEITKDNQILHYDFIDFDFSDPWRLD